MNVKMKNKFLKAFLTILTFVLLFYLLADNRTIHAEELYDTNLLMNGSFTEGTTHWDITGHLASEVFVDMAESMLLSYPDISDPLGNVLIYFPQEVGTITASQLVDLSDYSTNISNGFIRIQLSGYTMKYWEVSTNKIKLELLDEGGDPIPGEVYETAGSNLDGEDPNNSLTWDLLTIDLHSVNTATRAARVSLEATINDSGGDPALPNIYSDFVLYDGIQLILNKPGLVYAAGTFMEAPANDGTIATTKIVTLTDDTFTEGPFIENTHYTVDNLPDGLTLNVTRDSESQLTLSLTGNAIDHEAAAGVANLTISFLDAAFNGGNAAAVENSTKSNLAIGFADPPRLSYPAAAVFTENDTNDGSILNTINMWIEGDSFADAIFTENTHYTVTNIPDGFTLTVEKNNDQMLTLRLNGAATSHSSLDDVSDLTIEFLDPAFKNVAASRIINSVISDIRISFRDPSLDFVPGVFSESPRNDGSISTTLTVTLRGDSFVDEDFAEGTHYESANLPTGLSLVATRNSDTQLTLSIEGNAAEHEREHSRADITITFLDAAFTNGNANFVADVSKNDMILDFADAYVLTYSDETFSESEANDGTITKEMRVSLEGDIFVSVPFDIYTEGVHYEVANVPPGMTLTVTGSNSQQVYLFLSGAAVNHNNDDDEDALTIIFLDEIFGQRNASGVLNSTKNDMVIDFHDPELNYEAGAFTEAAANIGTVLTTKTVSLSGDTFAAGPFVENTHYTTANVPAGMELTVSRDSDSQLTLSLTGAALSHENDNDVSELAITFLDAAFSKSDAAEVINYSKSDMVVDFMDAPVLTYDAGAFTEAAANDGTVNTTKTVSLTGDTFVAGPFTQDTHYTVANVPGGMTMTVSRDSDTQLTLSLTGTALNHNNTDDKPNLTINFLNAAFANSAATGVINSTKSDMEIDFSDPVLNYEAGAFTEAEDNIGTVQTTKTVSLSGDTFTVGPFVKNTHYTTANVPVGMELVVSRDSNSQLTLSLTGAATAHENSNDVTNLTISFLNTAFSSSDAAEVINYSKSDMVVDFADAPELTINDVTHNEGDEGSVTYTFIVSLSKPAGAGVTFDIATADNTAEAGSDYIAKSLIGQTIPQGSSSYTFTVTVNSDTDYEDDESFYVNISNVSGVNVIDGQGIGTISNDDIAPVTLQSIAITTPASKLQYYVGEALDISGMVVTGSYSDGSTQVETITLTDVTGFNSSSPVGAQVLTVTVGTKTTSYTVSITSVPTPTPPVTPVPTTTPEPTVTPTPSVTPVPAPEITVNITDEDIQVEIKLNSELIENSDEQLTVSISSKEILDEMDNEELIAVRVGVNLPEQTDGNKADNIDLILESELIQKAKENKKDIVVDVKDSDNNVLYSWSFDKNELTNSDKDLTDVHLALKIDKAPEEVNYFSKEDDEEAVALVVDFAHEGVLPSQASVRIYVGDQEGVVPGTKVYLYHLNEDIGKLETIPYGYQAIVDEYGYITINILQCSDYVVLTKEADSEHYLSLRQQITVTPKKITLSLSKGIKKGKVNIELPITLEWAKSLEDPTSQSAIGGVTIKFSSSDKNIATVDSKGNITAKAPGEAVIKVTMTLYSKKTKKVEIRVKVEP